MSLRVDAREIWEHRSLSTLCAYERPTAEQMLETSKVLVPPIEKQSNQKAPSLVQNPMKEVVQSVAIHPPIHPFPLTCFLLVHLTTLLFRFRLVNLAAQLFAAEALVTQKLFLKNWKLLTWMSFSKTVKGAMCSIKPFNFLLPVK